MKLDGAGFGGHLNVWDKGSQEILKTRGNDDGSKINGDFRGSAVELWRKIS